MAKNQSNMLGELGETSLYTLRNMEYWEGRWKARYNMNGGNQKEKWQRMDTIGGKPDGKSIYSDFLTFSIVGIEKESLVLTYSKLVSNKKLK